MKSLSSEEKLQMQAVIDLLKCARDEMGKECSIQSLVILLEILCAEESQRMSVMEVAKKSGVSHTSVSRLINNYGETTGSKPKSGFISQTVNPDERRKTILAPTIQGLELAHQLLNAINGQKDIKIDLTCL